MKINRNNADINKLVDKKVAIVCDSKEKELDFRKWAKQYVQCIDDDYVYTNCGNGICISLEYDGLKWDYTNYYLENNYSIYKWGIAEEIKDAKPLTAEKKEILKSCLPQKTYTIRDIVDNKGKLYKDEYDTLYFYDDKLYCRTREEKKFRPSFLNLQQMLDLELTEYKEEPIKITFEEALKEMEQGKICESLVSGKKIELFSGYFKNYGSDIAVKLSYEEIIGDWIVVEE